MTSDDLIAAAALWGAATGTLALLIEVARFYLDRPRVRFHLINIGKGDGEYLRIEIINTGRRPVVIREIGLITNVWVPWLGRARRQRSGINEWPLLTGIDAVLDEQGLVSHDEAWQPLAVQAYESYGPTIRLKRVYAVTHNGKPYSAKLNLYHQTFGERVPPPEEWKYPSPPAEPTSAAATAAGPESETDQHAVPDSQA